MKYTFKDICTKIGSGATPTGGKEAYKGGDYALVRSQNVLDYTFTTSGLAYINETQAKKLDGVKVESGDVLLNITGDSVARACIIPDEILPARVNQHVAIIRANNQYALNEYLLYFLQYNKQYLLSISQGGGTRSAITKKMIEDIEIDLPSIEDQLAIVNIINTISKKIEVNQQINDNLEQQLKLLYRSWFIENKHPDSKEVCLSEIIYFQEGPGIRNWQYVEKDGIKFINIRCIEGGDINLTTANMISEEEANGKYAHFMLKPFDIIMSCSGTLGRYAIVRKEHLPLCLNTSVIRFSPNRSESDYSYIYGYLASEEFLNKQVEMACGSVQANFGPTHLKQIKIIAPPIDYCKSYHTAAMPIISKILENRREIQHLGKLRDTLLPKLMSGELKINEIDC